MNSKSVHFLKKEDLLLKLQQAGYEEIADILQDKDIDGEKLIKLREIDIVKWKLDLSRKTKLFRFIEKYKINPAILQIRPKPEVPHKKKGLQQEMQEKTLRPGKPPAVKPTVGAKPKPLVPKKSNQDQSLNKPFPRSPQLPQKPNVSKLNTNSSRTSRNIQSKPQLDVPSTNTDTCLENKPKWSQNVDSRALVPNPNHSGEKAMQKDNTASYGDYIDMTGSNVRLKSTVGTRNMYPSKLTKVFPPEIPKSKIEIPVSKAISRGPSPVHVIKDSDEEEDATYENPPELNDELKINKKIPQIPPNACRNRPRLLLETKSPELLNGDKNGNYPIRLTKGFPPELPKAKIEIPISKAISRGPSPVRVMIDSEEEEDGIYENPHEFIDELKINKKIPQIPPNACRNRPRLLQETNSPELLNEDKNVINTTVNKGKTSRGPQRFRNKEFENQIDSHEKSNKILPLPPRLVTNQPLRSAQRASIHPALNEEKRTIAKNCSTSDLTSNNNQQENPDTYSGCEQQDLYEDIDQQSTAFKRNYTQGYLHTEPNYLNRSSPKPKLLQPPIKTDNVKHFSNKNGNKTTLPVTTSYPNIKIDNKSVNSSESEDFLPEDTYEDLEKGDSTDDNTDNSYLDFGNASPIHPEDTDEELNDNEQIYENVPINENRQKQNTSSSFSKKIKDLFKFPNKPKEDLKPNSPNDNEGSISKRIDYDSMYRGRPLPEVPSTSASPASQNINDLPNPPQISKKDNSSSLSTSKFNSSNEEVFDDETDYLKPIEVFEDVKEKYQEKLPITFEKTSLTKSESGNDKSPAPIGDLAAELQRRLAQMKAQKKKSIGTPESTKKNINTTTTSNEDSEPDEFEPDPIYKNTENNKSTTNIKRTDSYEIHFINPPSGYKPVDDHGNDDDEEIYVQPVSKFSNNPFYRSTSNKGAKQYLEHLEDGAFLFRPSESYFLVMTVKFNNRYYHMGMEKTKNNKFRLAEKDHNYFPEFSDLKDFVNYFSKEAISLESDGRILDIVLKPILPKTHV